MLNKFLKNSITNLFIVSQKRMIQFTFYTINATQTLFFCIDGLLLSPLPFKWRAFSIVLLPNWRFPGAYRLVYNNKRKQNYLTLWKHFLLPTNNKKPWDFNNLGKEGNMILQAWKPNTDWLRMKTKKIFLNHHEKFLRKIYQSAMD